MALRRRDPDRVRERTRTQFFWRHHKAESPLSIEAPPLRRNEHRTSFLSLQHITSRQQSQEFAERLQQPQKVAELVESGGDCIGVGRIERDRKSRTLLLAAVHPILLVTLECLAHQVLFVKSEYREWH